MFQTLLHLPHRNINKGFDLYHLRRVVEQFGFCASFLRDFASSAFRVTVRGPSVTVALTLHSVWQCWGHAAHRSALQHPLETDRCQVHQQRGLLRRHWGDWRHHRQKWNNCHCWDSGLCKCACLLCLKRESFSLSVCQPACPSSCRSVGFTLIWPTRLTGHSKSVTHIWVMVWSAYGLSSV